MKALKIILIILGILILLVVIVSAYYGGFKKIDFKIENRGGEILVYENVIGDYAQTPDITNKIYTSLLNDEKIETTKGFGIFYDNPHEVEKSKLRSEVGCIVDNADSATIAKLSQNYQVKTLPINDYVTAEFPYKGKLSIFFGIMKVYPALTKYCKERDLKGDAIVEIYDVPNKKIIYLRETFK